MPSHYYNCRGALRSLIEDATVLSSITLLWGMIHINLFSFLLFGRRSAPLSATSKHASKIGQCMENGLSYHKVPSIYIVIRLKRQVTYY